VAGLVPTWVFWSLAAVILVRDGGRGGTFLALARLAGVAIDGDAIPIAGHFVFPTVLSGCTGFGPGCRHGTDVLVRSSGIRLGADGLRRGCPHGSAQPRPTRSFGAFGITQSGV